MYHWPLLSVSGYEWIGWRNESFPFGKPVEMVFEFDHVRNFTAMHLHINNFYSRGIQVGSNLIDHRNSRFFFKQYLIKKDRVIFNLKIHIWMKTDANSCQVPLNLKETALQMDNWTLAFSHFKALLKEIVGIDTQDNTKQLSNMNEVMPHNNMYYPMVPIIVPTYLTYKFVRTFLLVFLVCRRCLSQAVTSKLL